MLGFVRFCSFLAKFLTQRNNLESTGEIPQLDKTVGSDGKERPRQVERKPVSVFNPTKREEKALTNTP